MRILQMLHSVPNIRQRAVPLASRQYDPVAGRSDERFESPQRVPHHQVEMGTERGVGIASMLCTPAVEGHSRPSEGARQKSAPRPSRPAGGVRLGSFGVERAAGEGAERGGAGAGEIGHVRDAHRAVKGQCRLQTLAQLPESTRLKRHHTQSLSAGDFPPKRELSSFFPLCTKRNFGGRKMLAWKRAGMVAAAMARQSGRQWCLCWSPAF